MAASFKSKKMVYSGFCSCLVTVRAMLFSYRMNFHSAMNSGRPHCWLDLKTWALVPLKPWQEFLLTSSTDAMRSMFQQLPLWLFLSWNKTLKCMNVIFGNLPRTVCNSESPYLRSWKIPISRHLQQKSEQYPRCPGILPPKVCWPVNCCAFEDWNISGKPRKLYLQASPTALMGVLQLAYYTLSFLQVLD